jgi:hypothetical protein
MLIVPGASFDNCPRLVKVKHRNYLALIDDIEGRYHLKRLKPGVIKQSDKPKKQPPRQNGSQ